MVVGETFLTNRLSSDSCESSRKVWQDPVLLLRSSYSPVLLEGPLPGLHVLGGVKRVLAPYGEDVGGDL